MCELFGLSSRRPVSAAAELDAFRRRGGETAPNPDGWGLAWRDDAIMKLVKAPEPASGSAEFARLCAATSSDLIVGHVRKANFPPVNTLANTHPFQHVCCGRGWVFAHNGVVPEIIGMETRNDRTVCRPDGQTDSEYAFCHLLSHVWGQLQEREAASTADSFPALAAISEIVASHGKFNFLLSDGDYLIAYGHDRLHYRETADSAIVATEPLAGGDWRPFAAAELRIYRGGRLVHRTTTHPLAEGVTV